MLLQVKGLTTEFLTRRGTVRAVNGVDFELEEGEILGIVGESGCGKSTVLLSILGLIRPPGRVTGGEVLFEGRDLLSLPLHELRAVRGKDISMVFQDPMSTLNPVFPVGEQIAESMRVHRLFDDEGGLFGRRRTRRRERERVLELMEQVGISSPEARFREYPHQFSGGMQQRALIAIALACHPRLILADEPTTALDVTIQAQIVDLLRRINREQGTSIILVTHDLGLAAEFCDSIAVMYAGRLVEKGPAEQVIGSPRHPYTQGLLRSIPRIGHRAERIQPIPGTVPDLADLPPGCPFRPRCDFAQPLCSEEPVPVKQVTERHWLRCVL